MPGPWSWSLPEPGVAVATMWPTDRLGDLAPGALADTPLMSPRRAFPQLVNQFGFICRQVAIALWRVEAGPSKAEFLQRCRTIELDGIFQLDPNRVLAALEISVVLLSVDASVISDGHPQAAGGASADADNTH